LVRERRRQRELPLPVAEKVLPFRLGAAADASADDARPFNEDVPTSATDPLRFRVMLAEGRVAEAFATLQTAELRGSSRQSLDRLQEAYLAEVAAFQAVTSQAVLAVSEIC
jgi:hypothetical protein